AEVRLARVRVADALDHAHRRLVVEEAGQRVQRRVEAEVLTDALHLVLGNGKRGTELVVVVVLERDDGVEAVVAAGELHDDEAGVLGALLVGGRCGEGRAAEERRHAGAKAEERGLLQEGTASYHLIILSIDTE